MDNEILEYYKYIKTLDKISEYGINQYGEYIRLFNEYVSSNRNFKYNKTYLNDSIDGFFEICEVFKRKKQILQNFHKKILKDYESLEDWYIVFDHIFLVDGNKMVLIFDDLNNNSLISPIKKSILEKEIALLNLYNMDKYNIVIKYYLNSDIQDINYTEKISLNNEININSFVEAYLTKSVE